MSTSEAQATEEFDVQLPSGRLHCQRWGDPEGKLVLLVPGLTQNIKGFAFIAERIQRPGLNVVTVELRGRGRSDTGAPGTYGWENHARDMLALADALSARRFAAVGLSLGSAIVANMAALAPGRIQRLVLMDVVGIPDPRTGPPIMASAARLGGTHASFEAFLDVVKSAGTVRPWSHYWEDYYRYELVPGPDGGVVSRTNRDAVIEDATYTGSHDMRVFWPALTMPVLALRASEELVPGSGLLTTDEDKAGFLREVPNAELVEVDANHYGIAVHEDSARAIREFLKDY